MVCVQGVLLGVLPSKHPGSRGQKESLTVLIMVCRLEVVSVLLVGLEGAW